MSIYEGKKLARVSYVLYETEGEEYSINTRSYHQNFISFFLLKNNKIISSYKMLLLYLVAVIAEDWY